MTSAPTPARSEARLVVAMCQPLLSSPINADAGTCTSSKNTSLKSEVPVISLSGRTVMPGRFMSSANALMPACFASDGSVRASR